MALFDFLKRKKETEKSKKPTEKKTDKVSVVNEKQISKQLKRSTADRSAVLRKEKKEEKFSYEIIKEPHISERATNLAGANKYTFKVYSNSNKQRIKKAVEGIYGVDVLSVNTIKIPRKKRRLGRTEGFKRGYAKAVVTIKKGQKIEIF